MFNQMCTEYHQLEEPSPLIRTNEHKTSNLRPSQEQYGRPSPRSLSEARSLEATQQLNREVLQLCEIIEINGCSKQDSDVITIKFGKLFNIYNDISNKVVGILLSARKSKYVDFVGEILYQRRDEEVIISLIKPIDEIRRELQIKINEIQKSLITLRAKSMSEISLLSQHE